MEQLGYCLVQKIHLHLTRFCVGINGTKFHVPFQTRASYSLDMT